LDRGGAGFIGSHIIDLLLIEEHNVTIIDNFDQFHDISIKRENIKGHIEHESKCNVK
jgi:UDP-glucuronate 4-epimerase